jgi:hypothetical protein
MKTRLLDPKEFKGTLAPPMRDVLASATNVIDIWPYVASVPLSDLFGNTIVDGMVEHVYRNATDTFDHVMVVTSAKNVFLAIVVDLKGDAVFGHHLLDLNQEYGLVTQH